MRVDLFSQDVYYRYLHEHNHACIHNESCRACHCEWHWNRRPFSAGADCARVAFANIGAGFCHHRGAVGAGVFGHDWSRSTYWRRAFCPDIGVSRCRWICGGPRNARSRIATWRGMCLWICELVGGGRVGWRRQQRHRHDCSRRHLVRGHACWQRSPGSVWCVACSANFYKEWRRNNRAMVVARARGFVRHGGSGNYFLAAHYRRTCHRS